MTNGERHRRHIATIGDCPSCQGICETTLHVLRDCPIAVNIWKSILPRSA
ncbi:hypothetical protein LINGRAHAP2_LOCUS2195 [Linum grandiflorum]